MRAGRYDHRLYDSIPRCASQSMATTAWHKVWCVSVPSFHCCDVATCKAISRFHDCKMSTQYRLHLIHCAVFTREVQSLIDRCHVAMVCNSCIQYNFCVYTVWFRVKMYQIGIAFSVFLKSKFRFSIQRHHQQQQQQQHTVTVTHSHSLTVTHSPSFTHCHSLTVTHCPSFDRWL